MKYALFALLGVVFAVTIVMVSLWRQGQAGLFPQLAYVSPTPGSGQVLDTLLSRDLLKISNTYTPKILPMTPLYLPKMMWQKAELLIPKKNTQRTALLLERSNERMLIALYLLRHNSSQNAYSNLLKSQQYLFEALDNKEAIDSQKVVELQQKHLKIIRAIQKDVATDGSELIGEAIALNQAIATRLEK